MTREAEVRDALGGRLAPQGVSWPVFVGLVLVGLGALLGLVGTLSHAGAPSAAAPAPAQIEEAELSRAVRAYEAQEWGEAERLFRALRERHRDHVRVQDYLERIELTRRDAERLARAEEALVAGQYERARLAASEVAPNSALYAQAESLSRSARHHAAPAPELRGRTGASMLNSEVRVALGEALALYADGQYAEAAARADRLARKAHGATRQELAAWAQGVREFARGWVALPHDDPALLTDLHQVRELIELDQHLGEGAYARGLRQRVSEALERRAATEFALGELLAGCASHQRAGSFRVHERPAPQIEQRCESEGQRQLALARSLGRQHPEAARELYEQVRAMVAPDSRVHRAAQQALDSLAARSKPAR